jgi:hypothetical protein
MSPQNTSSMSAGASAGRKTARRGTASPESQARRGVELAIIRQGTPLQVEQLLSSLEASDDIGPDEEIIQDEAANDEGLLEMDADMDSGDEDEPGNEDWNDEGADLSAGDREREPDASPFAPRRFEIVVADGACSVPMDEKCIRSACTPFGQQVLYELESRFGALRRIAAWLTERRGEFLHKRDLWCLGCEALDDIKQGRSPVEQKSFLRCAGLEPRVSEASLSRYIRATEIAWTDGSAPLDLLFSDGAKRAWVANAVRQFVVESGERVSEAMLEEYASVPVKRSAAARRRLAQMSPHAMDLPSFIQKANMLAGTRWQDVVSSYRTKMLG